MLRKQTLHDFDREPGYFGRPGPVDRQPFRDAAQQWRNEALVLGSRRGRCRRWSSKSRRATYLVGFIRWGATVCAILRGYGRESTEKDAGYLNRSVYRVGMISSKRKLTIFSAEPEFIMPAFFERLQEAMERGLTQERAKQAAMQNQIEQEHRQVSEGQVRNLKLLQVLGAEDLLGQVNHAVLANKGTVAKYSNVATRSEYVVDDPWVGGSTRQWEEPVSVCGLTWRERYGLKDVTFGIIIEAVNGRDIILSQLAEPEGFASLRKVVEHRYHWYSLGSWRVDSDLQNAREAKDRLEACILRLVERGALHHG